MNTNKLLTIKFLGISSMILVMIGLAGCSTISIETVEANPGGNNPVETKVEMGNGTETGIGATPMPENLTYSNNNYGFEFAYPETWTLTEEDNGVVLVNGRYRLGIRFQGIDEDARRLSGRTGIPAGELIYSNKIRFMGRVIPAEVLVFEQKPKIVFYGGTGRIEINELVFSITLDDRETYNYSDVELSEEIMAEAKTIVETFERIERLEDPPQEPSVTETGLTALLEIPERLTIGEKINLKFVLKNVSNSPIYILKWYTPLEGIAGEIFMVTHDGRPVPYEGILAYRTPPTGDSYVILYPGEPVVAVVDLAEVFDFSRAGEYQIKFISPRISHIALTEDKIAQTMDELGPVAIPSNEVSVELVESSSGQGLARFHTPEEAQDMIEAYLRDQDLDLGNEPLIPVEELHVEELWDSLGAQVFRVIDGQFIKESYLIRGSNVIQLGAALGGQGVTSLALGDLDQDGQAELYYAYSSGAENPHSRIGIYVPVFDGHDIFEPEISYLGHLSVYPVGGLSIGVQVVEGDRDMKTLRYITSIGYLELIRQNGEMISIIHFEPGLADEILNNIVIE